MSGAVHRAQRVVRQVTGDSLTPDVRPGFAADVEWLLWVGPERVRRLLDGEVPLGLLRFAVAWCRDHPQPYRGDPSPHRQLARWELALYRRTRKEIDNRNG